jgi:predicted ATP-dependent endonuclease of OLD family
MHLKRVIVPDFRVLKDIDITFEPDLVPRIFPLGSLNGGGKSTLLQLIFTLLHCPSNPDRIIYLQNMLNGFEVNNEIRKRDLATIKIVSQDKDIELNFFVCTLDYVKHEIDSKYLKGGIQSSFLEWINEIKKHKEYCKRISEELEDKNNLFQLKSNRMAFLKEKHYLVCESSQYDSGVFLFCKFDGLKENEFIPYLENISQSVFLAAPITQVFLLLDREDRMLPFSRRGAHEYYYTIQNVESALPGFFAYNLLSVDLLIEAFTAARDDDFRIAISNDGKYGDNYQKLVKCLDDMLVDKHVSIDKDFAGVSFNKIDNNGHTIELYPEDMSHGELKRLSLYTWLKFKKIENAIVLMDEVEIALHPDWQYQIVNDLQTWAPNNQYILATHSHELCQALTPAHVKEIEPKLIKK